MDVTRHITKSAASMIWAPAASLFLPLRFTQHAVHAVDVAAGADRHFLHAHCSSDHEQLCPFLCPSTSRRAVQILNRIRRRRAIRRGSLIKNTISYMSTEKSGAFAPLLDHPIVRPAFSILGLVLSSALDLLPEVSGAS